MWKPNCAKLAPEKYYTLPYRKRQTADNCGGVYAASELHRTDLYSLFFRQNVDYPAAYYYCSMDRLNLPAISAAIKQDDGKTWIFDIIRKKYVMLMPEEWVRQHFIQYLVNVLHYPKALFRVEKSLTYNTLQKRSDILIYNRLGEPWMLIECKSSSMKLTQKTLNQVTIYNMTIGAKYLVVTNGMVHYCWKILAQNEGKATLLNRFPAFP